MIRTVPFGQAGGYWLGRASGKVLGGSDCGTPSAIRSFTLCASFSISAILCSCSSVSADPCLSAAISSFSSLASFEQLVGVGNHCLLALDVQSVQLSLSDDGIIARPSWSHEIPCRCCGSRMCVVPRIPFSPAFANGRAARTSANSSAGREHDTAIPPTRAPRFTRAGGLPITHSHRAGFEQPHRYRLELFPFPAVTLWASCSNLAGLANHPTESVSLVVLSTSAFRSVAIFSRSAQSFAICLLARILRHSACS